jgi:hypothetical protein
LVLFARNIVKTITLSSARGQGSQNPKHGPTRPSHSRCQYSNNYDFFQPLAYHRLGIAVISRAPEATRSLLKFLALSRTLQNEIQNTDTALDVADLRELIHSFV